MIILNNLTKNFGSKRIINDFSYQFPKSAKIAIVGANGVGKTTFLNIISGIEEHDSGNIIIPNDCIVGYLPQSPCKNPKDTILNECICGSKKLSSLQIQLNQALKDIEESYSEEKYFKYESLETEFSNLGGYELEADAKGILIGLGFEHSQLDQSPNQLSGGWKMRLELAKLLINYPNFLILDEPTNHLDLPSLTWLEQYLQSFNGTLIFVSHDKEFINNISNMIMHISNGNINLYSGNFDAFLLQKEENDIRVTKEKESIKKQKDHLQSYVDRFRYKASKAKQAQSRLKMIEKLKQIEERLGDDSIDKKVSFKIPTGKPSSKVVLEINDGAIGYENIINKNINLKIIKGQKIAIIGSNGIGKSTLLKSIIGEIPFLSGKSKIGTNVSIGYHSQNLLDVLDPNMDILQNIIKLSPDTTIQQARSLLGQLLITGDEIYKKVSVLSGGEKSKVSMAAMLAQKNNFLILDEPTNHLDMSSTEALSDAIINFEGTVLIVSHNRSFINSFATHLFVMDKYKNAELVSCN